MNITRKTRIEAWVSTQPRTDIAGIAEPDTSGAPDFVDSPRGIMIERARMARKTGGAWSSWRFRATNPNGETAWVELADIEESVEDDNFRAFQRQNP